MASILNIDNLALDLAKFTSINLISSTFSNDPDLAWQLVTASLYHCEFEDFIRNRKLSKYLGASKWKNEVMVIKNTPNENDWPRAVSEMCQKK